ncbi:hypothetical protein NIES2107_73020 (plasmid) [Nostoc carneum NIES-2107]|nr:hypothetical protein NIES2107_73020 [Nostoc carneum NIES-2107]
MMQTKAIRVLVVEDDPQWRLPIEQMYSDILPKDSYILSLGSGEEAVRLLKGGTKFDLLSLDINLQSTCTSSSEVYADGRTVLRNAYELRACSAVIVITGLPYDETLEFITPIERDKLVATLSCYLDDFFGNNLHLTKPRLGNLTISDCIEVFKAQLPQKKLLNLCASPSWGYKIQIYDSQSESPDISIKKRGTKAAPVQLKGVHAQLVMALVDAHYEGKILSKQEVCAIYYPDFVNIRGSQLPFEKRHELQQKIQWGANRGISDFKRYMKGKVSSFIADDLFQVLARKGYKLTPGTEIVDEELE